MSTIEESIDVAVPLRTAYDQWTQFEEFPRFMEGVDHIAQVTPTRTHWETSIAGVRREFDAEIVEQRPDERVVWRSLTEPRQAGVVTFQSVAPTTTRVRLRMEFAPTGFAEQAADKLHLVEHRVKGDLQRFKDFIETRRAATGAWRGEVPAPPGQPARPEPVPGQFPPEHAAAPQHGAPMPPQGGTPPYEAAPPRQSAYTPPGSAQGAVPPRTAAPGARPQGDVPGAGGVRPAQTPPAPPMNDEAHGLVPERPLPPQGAPMGMPSPGQTVSGPRSTPPDAVRPTSVGRDDDERDEPVR